MLRLRALVLLASLVAVACTHESWTSAPYIWPTPAYGEPPVQSFRVRYSEYRNTEEEIRDLISRQCAPSATVARVWTSPYRGTALHPNEMGVNCGVSPAPTPWYRGIEVPETREIALNRPLNPPAGAAPAP